MRRSIAAVALIRQSESGHLRYLAQWNPNWRCYNFISGHKRDAESFRECMLREIAEELQIEEGMDFHVLEGPLTHLEFEAWSESAKSPTLYIMEVFEVKLRNNLAWERVTADERNRWLDEQEISRKRAEDGERVSQTMEFILQKIRRLT